MTSSTATKVIFSIRGRLAMRPIRSVMVCFAPFMVVAVRSNPEGEVPGVTMASRVWP